jgi:hypothetical protein
MPTLQFPIAALIERLEGTDPIKFIGLTPDLHTALESGARLTPAVFVMSETRGGPIKFSGPPVQQDRETTVKLLPLVSHHGDAAARAALMTKVLEAIDKRLAGWTPGDAFEALRLIASRDELVHGQYLAHQALYASNWNFSAQVQP